MGRLFEFTGTWQIGAPVDDVVRVLTDLGEYPTWWPQVLAVAALGPDDARVLCRSRLPYTLDLVLHSVTRTAPLLQAEITGDLSGTVAWHVHEGDHDDTWIRLEQRVTVGAGLLATAARVAAPVLRWNHEQMMRSGITGLRGVLSSERLQGPGPGPAGAAGR